MTQTNKVLQGDCLELIKDIPDGSVDMILAEWDKVKQNIKEYII